MKKLLLSCMALFMMGGVTFADEVVSYEPDEEFTSVAAIGDNMFAIVNKEDGKAIYNGDAQNLYYDEYFKAFSTTVQGYYWKLESLADNADESVRDCYLLKIVKTDGSNVSFWGHPAVYLNSGKEGGFNGCFVLGNGDQFGTDVAYGGVWYVEYAEGKGFALKNKARNGYFAGVNPAPTGEDPIYWTFCTLKEGTVENPIEQGAYDATDANTSVFADFAPIAGDATYNATTKVFTKNCGWKWDGEGVDLSHYRYIVITAGSSREEAGAGYMYIKDKNGVRVGGDEYGEDYQNLWFSTWNHLFCCKIDLEKLRQEKMLDIYHITELGIDGGDYFMLGTAYATNKEPQVRNRWGQNEEGSVRITGLTTDKFGTICLPYQAAVACAKIYEIDGIVGNEISLSEVDGLMEAGKPYFYCTTKNTADAATENKVFFYQATAATVDTPVENNGLIGTFTGTTINNNDFYVLSNNKLYYADQDVTVGANRAYIDITKIENQGGSAKVRLAINENATAVEDVQAAGVQKAGKIYDFSGREVTNPTKGFYIIDGKKTFIQ